MASWPTAASDVVQHLSIWLFLEADIHGFCFVGVEGEKVFATTNIPIVINEFFRLDQFRRELLFLACLPSYALRSKIESTINDTFQQYDDFFLQSCIVHASTLKKAEMV